MAKKRVSEGVDLLNRLAQIMREQADLVASQPIEDVRAWLRERDIDPDPLIAKVKALVGQAKSS